MGPARAAVLRDVLVAHGRERDGPGPPVMGGREVLGRDGRERERGLAVSFLEEKEGRKGESLSRSPSSVEFEEKSPRCIFFQSGRDSEGPLSPSLPFSVPSCFLRGCLTHMRGS